MRTTRKQQGFTIVELLIVIVVIAILASISIVAYNGIQARAKTSAALSMSEIVINKAEAVNALTGHYPTAISDFELNKDTSLAGTDVVFSSVVLDGTQSPSTLLYSLCSPAAPTGFKLRYWDYATGSIVNTNVGTLVGPCTVTY